MQIWGSSLQFEPAIGRKKERKKQDQNDPSMAGGVCAQRISKDALFCPKVEAALRGPEAQGGRVEAGLPLASVPGKETARHLLVRQLAFSSHGRKVGYK